jgi:inorganic pyrophosphatase
LRVFIENEAGSRRKNIYDERTLTYLRTVEVSRAYPFPYGFVIGTRSGDGDCVDCFVLTAATLSSGIIVECDPIGLLEQVEDGEVDHKVLAVLIGERIALDDVVVAPLKHFITGVFAHVPGKRMEIGRLLSRPEAEAYVNACRDDF